MTFNQLNLGARLASWPYASQNISLNHRTCWINLNDVNITESNRASPQIRIDIEMFATKCAWLCLTTPLLNFWTSKAVAKALPELLESLHLSLLLTGSVTASLLTLPPRSCTAQDCNDDSSKRFKAHPFHALVFFLTAVLKARDDLCNSIHWNLARALESGCFAFCFHAPAIHWPSIKQDTANNMWFTVYLKHLKTTSLHSDDVEKWQLQTLVAWALL